MSEQQSAIPAAAAPQPSAKSCLSYVVCYGDTDMMGVVYYANYLVLFERARTKLLQDLGFPYRTMEGLGFALPILEAHAEYKAPATYEDVLEVWAWVEWIKGARLKVCCEVRRDGKLLVAGHTIHACMRIADKRPVRVIPELIACCPQCVVE